MKYPTIAINIKITVAPKVNCHPKSASFENLLTPIVAIYVIAIHITIDKIGNKYALESVNTFLPSIAHDAATGILEKTICK